MPYLSRLIEDSGISIPSAGVSASAPATPGATSVDSLESIETVEISQGPSGAPQVPPPAESAPGPVIERPIVQEHTASPLPAVDVPDLNPTPSDASATSPVLRHQPNSPPPVVEQDVVIAPAAEAQAPAGEVLTPPTYQQAAQELPSSERILRTLAAVREWTAGTPEPGVRPAGTQPLEQQTFVAATGRSGEPLIEVIQTPPMRDTRAPLPSPSSWAERDETAPRPPAEPEVVNLSVSIGAIELTVDAPAAAEPAPSRPAQEQASPGPDAVARLRRHYYRPPIGW